MSLGEDRLGFGDLEVTVDDIEWDAPCPTGSRQPEDRLVGVDLTVRALEPDEDVVSVAIAEWVTEGPSGERPADWRTLALPCQPPADQFPTNFDEGEEVSGRMLFDVPADTERFTLTLPWIEPSPEVAIVLP